jgi:hypothetical protein
MTAKFYDVPGGGCSALDANLSPEWNEQAIDQFEAGGFARAAAAEQHEGLARVDDQAQIFKKGAIRGNAVRNVFELDDGLGSIAHGQ